MFLSLIPSQFRLLAFAVLLAVTFVAGGSTAWKLQAWRYGSAIAEQKAEAALALTLAQTAARKKEREHEQYRNKVEVDYLKAKAETKRLASDNRRLAAQLGGLRDPGYRQGSECTLPGDSDTASSDSSPAPGSGRLLSKQLEEYIFDSAEQADEITAYAWACHEWATGLK